jgi:hypothetical protein
MKRLTGCSLLAALWLGGCAKDCTDIGCVEGLELQFREPLPGEKQYQFVLRGDGLDVSCSSGPGRGTCWDQRLDVMKTEAGIISVILLEPLPSRVEIEVIESGVVLIAESVAPEYSVSYPNGPECGSCTQAVVRL